MITTELLEPRRLFAANFAFDLSTDGVRPRDFMPYAGGVAFTGETVGLGSELWTTDGTAAGTRNLIDLVPGKIGSAAKPVAAIGKFLLFTATDGKRRTGLWATDGTAKQTHLLVESDRKSLEKAFGEFTVFGKSMLFRRYEASTESFHVWRTNGSAAGTAKVVVGISTSLGRIDLGVAGRYAYFWHHAKPSVLIRSEGTRGGAPFNAPMSTGGRGTAVGDLYVLPMILNDAAGLYQIEPGGIPTLVKAFSDSIAVPAATPDFAYIAAKTSGKTPYQLYRYDGQSLTQVTSLKSALLDAGTLFRATAQGIYFNSGSNFHFIGNGDKTPRFLATLPPDTRGRLGSIDGFDIARDGTIFAGRLIKGRTELFRINSRGVKSIGLVDGGYNMARVVGNTVYFARADATGVGELFRLRTNKSQPTQLTALDGSDEDSGVAGMAPVRDGVVALTGRRTLVSFQPQLHTVAYFLRSRQAPIPLLTMRTIIDGQENQFEAHRDRLQVFDADGIVYFTVLRASASGGNTSDLYRTDGTADGTSRVAADLGSWVGFLGRAGRYAFFGLPDRKATIAVPLAGKSASVTFRADRDIEHQTVAIGNRLYAKAGDKDIIEFNGDTGSGRQINLTARLPEDSSLQGLQAWRGRLLLINRWYRETQILTFDAANNDAIRTLAAYEPFGYVGFSTELLPPIGDQLWLINYLEYEGSRLTRIDLLTGATSASTVIALDKPSSFAGTLSGKPLLDLKRDGRQGLYQPDGDGRFKFVEGTQGAYGTQVTPEGMYFRRDNALWLHDGNTSFKITDLGNDGGAIRAADGRFYFTGSDVAHGREVWSYRRQPSRIRGTVFNDANADGVRGSTEIGLAGWRVFLDANGDGVYQRGERSVFTDAAGHYAFDDLEDGRYIPTLTPPATHVAVTPVAYSVRLTLDANVTRNFGVQPIVS